jgi:hypothetical protein
MLVSPRNVTFDYSSRLRAHCTNNQAKYKTLLFDLVRLHGVKTCKGIWWFSASCPTSFGKILMFRRYFEWLSWKILRHKTLLWRIWDLAYIQVWELQSKWLSTRSLRLSDNTREIPCFWKFDSQRSAEFLGRGPSGSESWAIHDSVGPSSPETRTVQHQWRHCPNQFS